MRKLKIDALLSYTKQEFDKINDKRAENSHYSLGDVLQSGLAMFSLKDSSLLEFSSKFSKRGENIKRIYKVEKCPSDTQFRSILDKISPIQIERIKKKVLGLLKEEGLLKDYEYIKSKSHSWKILLVDGVKHFDSKKVSCDNCLIRNHTDGSVSYSHSMLAAVIVHPDKKEVLSLAEEPIIQQDGQTKNDCELNASNRLIEKIATRNLGENLSM